MADAGKTGETVKKSGRYAPDDGGKPIYVSEGETFPPSSKSKGASPEKTLRDEIWAEMLAAGEVAPVRSVRYWTYASDRDAAEAEIVTVGEWTTHVVIAYGPRGDNLRWLYRIYGDRGEGEGEDAMRAFMREHGDG